MSRTVMSRGRALASLTTVVGLGLAASAVAAGPAQSVTPTGDCAAAYPVSELTAGQAVDTLTVTSGTTPSTFSGSVLGVVKDGIAPDVDMIMVRLDSVGEVGRVGGIWEGMSGSPVYAKDGRLIGAIAYGLSYGPSTVAGVTPFDSMDDYLPTGTTPTQVPVGARAARTIASATDVTATEAAEGFSQLEMPLGVSGVSGARLARAERPALVAKHAWLPTSTYKMGAAAAAGDGPGAETIAAGGNLAASLSYGDVTAAGVGTATSVCQDRVVGFGHPMEFSGDSTMSLHPADALYIQEESLGAPFKVANLGAPVGTITDDHLTGITGTLGTLPAYTPITSTVTYRDRSRTGTTQDSVQDFVASGTFYQTMLNHDRVIDGIRGGSELQSWSMDLDVDGQPMTLTGQNRFADATDITWASSGQLADLAWLATEVPGVSVDKVDVTSDVTDNSSTFQVSGLQQKVSGHWVTVGKGTPVLARAGRTVTMRAILTSGTTKKLAPFSFAVSPKMAGGSGRMYVSGNQMMWFEDEGYYGDGTPTLADVKKAAAQTRNDQVSAVLELDSYRGYKVSRTRTTPQAKVVSGSRSVSVRVR